MKPFKFIVLFLLIASLLTFAYQNLQKVNVNFIVWNKLVPFSLTIFLAFLAGLITGAIIFFFLGKKSKTKKKDTQNSIEETYSKSYSDDV